MQKGHACLIICVSAGTATANTTPDTEVDTMEERGMHFATEQGKQKRMKAHLSPMMVEAGRNIWLAS